MNWKLLSIFKVSTVNGSMIHFEYDGKLDILKAKQIQYDRGYHPDAYGFTCFDVRNGCTYWRCHGEFK